MAVKDDEDFERLGQIFKAGCDAQGLALKVSQDFERFLQMNKEKLCSANHHFTQSDPDL